MMRRNVVKILLSSALMVALTLFGRVQAVGEDFFVEVSPEVPGPNMTVNAKLMSYSFDVDRAYIVWSVDGAKKSEGRGSKSFSFKTGGRGEKTSLSVSITTESGLQLSKTLNFIPAEVDLLWKAETYTPISYKGKAMSVPEATVTVTAVPHFGKYASQNSSNLIYNWELDYKKKQDFSGPGKNSFTFRTDGPFNESTIGVEVTDYAKTAIAKNSINIKNHEPKLLFYKDHHLEGPSYDKTIGKMFDLADSEILIRAEPYFFSIPKDESSLSFEWEVNGEKIAPESPNVIDLRTDPGSGTGQSEVSASARHLFKDFQSAFNSFRINFGI